ncbi:MAG: ATP phosphoribosyltransferase regulatory subunit [Hyphomicrobiales bacterium]
MSAPNALTDLFESYGCTPVEPAFLQPADPFLNAAGEALRRRLFVTQSAEGEALCLRPEFTIPVCIAHKGGAAKYCYQGTVFRQRDEQAVEFAQAGVEVLGDNEFAKADAEMVRLALQAVQSVSDCQPEIRIGDPAFFDALVQPMGLSDTWRDRLTRSFGDDALVGRVLERMDTPVTASQTVAEDENLDEVTAKVRAMIASHGLGSADGRSAEEIAARFMKTRQAQEDVPGQAIGLCKLFLELECDASSVASTFEIFSEEHEIDFSQAIVGFKDRLDAGLSDLDVPLKFSAGFGRRLDYYTGFVFEIYDANDRSKGALAGGGRYDHLTEMLGGEKLPAVGFSLWLDRMEARS